MEVVYSIKLRRNGGFLLFNYNYNIDHVEINSKLYRELLQWWAESRESFAEERDWQFIIWNNKEVASWLECSTPDRVVRVRVLAEDVVLCSWTRRFTLTLPVSTQVYKWDPRENAGGDPAME